MIIKQIRSLGDYDDGYYISWWSDIYLMHYHVIIFNILQHLCLSLLLIDNIYIWIICIYIWYIIIIQKDLLFGMLWCGPSWSSHKRQVVTYRGFHGRRACREVDQVPRCHAVPRPRREGWWSMITYIQKCRQTRDTLIHPPPWSVRSVRI